MWFSQYGRQWNGPWFHLEATGQGLSISSVTGVAASPTASASLTKTIAADLPVTASGSGSVRLSVTAAADLPIVVSGQAGAVVAVTAAAGLPIVVSGQAGSVLAMRVAASTPITVSVSGVASRLTLVPLGVGFIVLKDQGNGRISIADE